MAASVITMDAKDVLQMLFGAPQGRPAEPNNALAYHVQHLADEGGVEVNVCYDWDHRYDASAGAGRINIAEVVDEETYAIAMHELGHERAKDGHSPTVIVAERAAWSWAYDHMVWKSPMMEAVRAYVMGDATKPDIHHATYERQAVLEPFREELKAAAAVMPGPNGETIKGFMQRRKR